MINFFFLGGGKDGGWGGGNSELCLKWDGEGAVIKSTFKFLGGCQGWKTGVGVTTVSNLLILGGWVTKVLKNDDRK